MIVPGCSAMAGDIDGGECRWPRRLVKRAHLGARTQQFLDLGTEPDIAGTGLVHEARPLLRRVFFDRREKDRFCLIARIAHDDRSRGTSPLCRSMRILAAVFLTARLEK